ncbi:hypothetical protein [Endozoicomonas lisbonensis]|uniref:Capsule biosynthesis GfcC-like C-terminal domain-containing protein n=1 Tax=Endozoicomonas lisbonensis TaxID=3120522 RepID=A0ABV2SHX3_9GAMM
MKLRQLLSGLAASALSVNLCAYSPSDQPGVIYKGLQNLDEIANTLSFDRQQSLGTIGKNNVVSSFLSPWDKDRVTEVINSTGDLKQAAKKVIAGTFKPAPLYDLSGFDANIETFMNIVDHGSFLKTYTPEARGITLDDTDALSVPTDTPLTKDLAGTANTATDQKSSSTRIPANTPVYILGQLFDLNDTISPEEDSWFLIWREEFGLKFVRSRHIGRLSSSSVESFREAINKTPKMVRTPRVERTFVYNNYKMLMPGTMPVILGAEEGVLKSVAEGGEGLRSGAILMANRSGTKVVSIDLTGRPWAIYEAKLVSAQLNPKDPDQKLPDHLKSVPVTSTVQNYLEELHNVIFHYPGYAGFERNYHRSFAWGEGITGIDEQRGQDISNFVYKLMLGFGHRLPRYSGDQIREGLAINTIVVDKSTDKESYHKTLVKHCTLGRIASFASNGHIVCIGSVSIEQLGVLDPAAAADALNNGMSFGDLVPLVATSPVGLRDEETGIWTIIPKAAVFPIFKTGPYSSWISRKDDLKIFSFFKDSPSLTTKTEL